MHLPYSRLIEQALLLGATRAALLPADQVRIEDRLAAYCREPKCPNFGQSLSCPPHVPGPGWLRTKLKECQCVVVLRLEIDAASLHGEDRPAVMRALHDLTAAVEKQARTSGFPHALGLAGGSCKMSFCRDLEQCPALVNREACRFPGGARQSLSGFGVNVGELMKSAGWGATLFSSKERDGGEELAWVAGMVLLC